MPPRHPLAAVTTQHYSAPQIYSILIPTPLYGSHQEYKEVIMIVTFPHNYNMCMSCSQMSSETPQNVLTQQYHGMHHLSNAGDGELLGGSVLLCAQGRFTHHMVYR